jgi:hypothetical protein
MVTMLHSVTFAMFLIRHLARAIQLGALVWGYLLGLNRPLPVPVAPTKFSLEQEPPLLPVLPVTAAFSLLTSIRAVSTATVSVVLDGMIHITFVVVILVTPQLALALPALSAITPIELMMSTQPTLICVTVSAQQHGTIQHTPAIAILDMPPHSIPALSV